MRRQLSPAFLALFGITTLSSPPGGGDEPPVDHERDDAGELPRQDPSLPGQDVPATASPT